MSKHYLPYYLAASVGLITVAVYLPALRNDFVRWDDYTYVVNNLHIRSLNAAFFQWAFLDLANFWYPLAWISHALDYFFWGLDPRGHHLTSILLHGANASFVVVLAQELSTAAFLANGSLPGSKERTVLTASVATGLLFGLHPIHVESVAWISERKDILCALFFLLSVRSYVRYALRSAELTSKNAGTSHVFNRQYLLALAFFILALLSKPMAVSLPLVLIILDWYPFGRFRSLRGFEAVLVEKIPFLGLSIAVSLLTVLTQHSRGAVAGLDAVPASTRALAASTALIMYLAKMAWPLHLIPFYPHPRHLSFLSPANLAPALGILAITIACLRLARERKLYLAAWLYYLATLLPVIGIVQVGSVSMADRYTYLPSLGPFLLLGLGAALFREKSAVLTSGAPIAARIGSAAAVLLMVCLPFLTISQIGVWRDTISLWTYVIEKGPYRVVEAFNNRAMAYEERGEFGKALEDYTDALAVDPNEYRTYNNRGLAWYSIGKLKEAIDDYTTALALYPGNPEAYNNRGVVLEEIGRFDEALADYTRALELDPSYFNASNNRGIVLEKIGLLEKAVEAYGATIVLDPSFADAYANRGTLHRRLGREDLALADFQQACGLGSVAGCAALREPVR